jgi:large subunit ribosomal protein L10
LRSSLSNTSAVFRSSRAVWSHRRASSLFFSALIDHLALTECLAKEGAVLTKEKVGALQMLGIKPFKVGLTIWRAFDGKMVFNADVLGLSAEQLVEGLKHAISQGFSMSINANYPTQSNISILLTNAIRQGKAIGVGSGAYSEGVMPELLAKAFSQGNALNAIEKKSGG